MSYHSNLAENDPLLGSHSSEIITSQEILNALYSVFSRQPIGSCTVFGDLSDDLALKLIQLHTGEIKILPNGPIGTEFNNFVIRLNRSLNRQASSLALDDLRHIHPASDVYPHLAGYSHELISFISYLLHEIGNNSSIGDAAIDLPDVSSITAAVVEVLYDSYKENINSNTSFVSIQSGQHRPMDSSQLMNKFRISTVMQRNLKAKLGHMYSAPKDNAIRRVIPMRIRIDSDIPIPDDAGAQDGLTPAQTNFLKFIIGWAAALYQRTGLQHSPLYVVLTFLGALFGAGTYAYCRWYQLAMQAFNAAAAQAAHHPDKEYFEDAQLKDWQSYVWPGLKMFVAFLPMAFLLFNLAGCGIRSMHNTGNPARRRRGVREPLLAGGQGGYGTINGSTRGSNSSSPADFEDISLHSQNDESMTAQQLIDQAGVGETRIGTPTSAIPASDARSEIPVTSDTALDMSGVAPLSPEEENRSDSSSLNEASWEEEETQSIALSYGSGVDSEVIPGMTNELFNNLRAKLRKHLRMPTEEFPLSARDRQLIEEKIGDDRTVFNQGYNACAVYGVNERTQYREGFVSVGVSTWFRDKGNFFLATLVPLWDHIFFPKYRSSGASSAPLDRELVSLKLSNKTPPIRSKSNMSHLSNLSDFEWDHMEKGWNGSPIQQATGEYWDGQSFKSKSSNSCISTSPRSAVGTPRMPSPIIRSRTPSPVLMYGSPSLDELEKMGVFSSVIYLRLPFFCNINSSRVLHENISRAAGGFEQIFINEFENFFCMMLQTRDLMILLQHEFSMLAIHFAVNQLINWDRNQYTKSFEELEASQDLYDISDLNKAVAKVPPFSQTDFGRNVNSIEETWERSLPGLSCKNGSPAISSKLKLNLDQLQQYEHQIKPLAGMHFVKFGEGYADKIINLWLYCTLIEPLFNPEHNILDSYLLVLTDLKKNIPNADVCKANKINAYDQYMQALQQPMVATSTPMKVSVSRHSRNGNQ